MSLGNSGIVVRTAKLSDAVRVSNLFCEDGTNPYDLSAQKWLHYYNDYPEGQPVALVAEIDGEIVGHYGMLPIHIGDSPAMLGLHAYVSTKCRGLTVISALMAEVDNICRARGAAMICGFANSKFALIKKTFYKWHTPLWLGFKKGTALADTNRENSPFYFKYSDAWYTWRFGEERDYYLSCFTDAEGILRKQLLKARNIVYNVNMLADSECWSKSDTYPKDPGDRFYQPFSVKIFDKSFIDRGVLLPENWFIEMGDSDTFRYTAWRETVCYE